MVIIWCHNITIILLSLWDKEILNLKQKYWWYQNNFFCWHPLQWCCLLILTLRSNSDI